jgi:hypothetical protein
MHFIKTHPLSFGYFHQLVNFPLAHAFIPSYSVNFTVSASFDHISSFFDIIGEATLNVLQSYHFWKDSEN